MKKLLLSVLVAIAAVLSSCKVTTDVDANYGSIIAGTYKCTNTSSSYDKVIITRVSDKVVDIKIDYYYYYSDEYYTGVDITKSGSTYSLSGGTKSTSADTFSGSVSGNDLTLGIVYGTYVESIKASK